MFVTDVCHCVCIRYDADKQATQEARDKSKAGDKLTESEARYIARYCHSALCHSLTRLSPSVHIY